MKKKTKGPSPKTKKAIKKAVASKKKVPAKKTVAKKASAKKSATKKPTSSKTMAKKVVSKKTTTAKATRTAKPAKAKAASPKAGRRNSGASMPQSYDHSRIEKKWQKYWEQNKFYQASEQPNSEKSLAKHPKGKFYTLVEFPFPSGAGLHTGHIRSYTALDTISRKKRAEGYDVLFPIGWDAFGLPTENYAIKTGIQPQKATNQNTDNFRRQLKSLGLSFDWSREINTTDPKYYKWTQWIFLQMYKKGLAYKSKMTINWCPKDKVGLANEEVINGCCERCGTPVEKRDKEQWMLAITKYADRLDKDLDTVDYLEKIKIQQRNWIGRSEGVNFKCNIKDLDIEVEMYNSVPQSYCAETFTVIAPEHPLVETLVKGTEYEKDVLQFVDVIKKKKAANKFDVESDMEGIFTGRYIENFAGTGRDLPIWIASYVLVDYGTGIVNASAHDTRDYAFAKKYDIPLHGVLEPLIVRETGEDAFRKDMPISERDAVVAVIKHWSEDKYLGVRWKRTNWQGFVIGGIEKNEDAADAGIREIQEETGYQNIEVVKNLGGKVHAKFYQALKKENRFAHFEPVLYQLKDGERTVIDTAEQALHDLIWLSAEEMEKFITHDDMKIVWSRVIGKEKPIIKSGILNAPEQFKGREWSEVRKDVIDYVVSKGYATRKTNYKLRDWIFSRQRYWGEPIPMIHCEKCGWQPVPEKDLPVTLPPVKKYEPTDSGESPLAAITSWVNTKCPTCKGKATRETDTMPNWAGSSWYYLRYIDPKNAKAFADKEKLKSWLSVDWYNGGMEHTTLHLLYSRFWHKFLYDIGEVSTIEPYKKRTSHGMILAEGGEKMSKSKGNTINPDDLVRLFGADTLRVYEMFMGPFDQAIAWNTDNMVGSRRFIERVYAMGVIFAAAKAKASTTPSEEFQVLFNKTIKKIGDDIETLGFNTAISSLMILLNAFEKEMTKPEGAIPVEYFESFLKLLAPFAPHVTDELWSHLGHKKSIHLESWPSFDESKLTSSTFNIAVQINGKVRAVFQSDTDEEKDVVARALALPEIQEKLGGQEPKKTFYIKGRTVNLVI